MIKGTFGFNNAMNQDDSSVSETKSFNNATKHRVLSVNELGWYYILEQDDSPGISLIALELTWYII